MTPDIKLIKKIQPLFTEWKKNERLLYLADSIPYEVIFISRHSERITFLDDGVTLSDGKQWLLRYPYPHQLWEKVDWTKLDFYFCGGVIDIVESNTDKTIIGEQDLETALLKALVWQMEEGK